MKNIFGVDQFDKKPNTVKPLASFLPDPAEGRLFVDVDVDVVDVDEALLPISSSSSQHKSLS
ncbi:MAG: hypothetical protein IKD58_17465 [Loktanella sp.]|nr:hypothetical protein [Loktanella sp.]